MGEDVARLASASSEPADFDDARPAPRVKPVANRAQRRTLEKALKRKAKHDPKTRQLLGALEERKGK